MNRSIRSMTPWLPICAAVAGLGACGGGALTIVQPPAPPAFSAATACAGMTSSALASLFPAANTTIQAAVLQAGTATLPEHCQVDGQINARTGVDGQPYAINFR